MSFLPSLVSSATIALRDFVGHQDRDSSYRRRVIHYSVQSQEVSYLGQLSALVGASLLARLLNGTFALFAVRRRPAPKVLVNILRSPRMIVWNAMTRFPE